MTLPIRSCETDRHFSMRDKIINFDQPCYRKDCCTVLFSLQKILQNYCHMKGRSKITQPKEMAEKSAIRCTRQSVQILCSSFNFQARHPLCIDRITGVVKLQSETTFNFYLCTVRSEIHVVHTPTNALFCTAYCVPTVHNIHQTRFSN